MKQPFTPNLLVKFLYRETSASETLAVNEALHQDPALLAEYDNLLEAYEQLPKVTFQPSKAVIRNILSYSEQTALESRPERPRYKNVKALSVNFPFLLRAFCFRDLPRKFIGRSVEKC